MMSRVVLSAVRSVARPAARRVFVQPTRAFAAGFLDSAEVAERIQNVVKNFEKVDAAAVSPTAHFTNDLGACVKFFFVASRRTRSLMYSRFCQLA